MENTTVASQYEEIIAFLESCCSPELKQEIINGISFITMYSNTDFENEVYELFHVQEDPDTDVIQAEMILLLEEGLRDTLRKIGLSVLPETTIAQMNQIIAAVRFVQYVEDPVPFLRIFETWDSDEEKVAKALSQLTSMDEATLLSCIENVSQNFITATTSHLKAIEARQAMQDIPEKDSEMIEKISLLVKNFIEFKGENNIGFSMLTNGIQIGYESELYLPFIEDVLDAGDVDQTAENLISFFLMTSDGYNKPIELYRKLSEQLIKEPRRIQPIETKMRSIMEEFEQYQKAKNDAQRLSTV